LKSESYINYDYYYNLRGSLNSPQNNSISLKVLYYIDYMTIKRSLSRKRGTK